MGLTWAENWEGVKCMCQVKENRKLTSPFHLPSVLIYLGFERSELLCKSWYGLLHPEDLAHASSQHYRLCECPERLWITQEAGRRHGK